jgi:type II secretory pathway predicted ATPase ExeA
VDSAPEPRIDPFGDTANPSLYVPREATERALIELVECGTEPARPAVLLGPPGIGKSLLLRRVEESIQDIEYRVFLAYPCLDTKGLCMWVLDSLRSPPFEDPVFAFEAYLAHLREVGSGLLLLIDELCAMPPDTLHWLSRYLLTSKGEFRLIASALDDPHSLERIAPLGPACETILVESPMQPEESAQYVRERLALAGVPESIRARFDQTTVAELHRLSGGNPRELNAAATRILMPHPADTLRP